MIDTGVIVAGGGPVGLTLAIDLAWRGIDVTVIEPRRPAEAPGVKCNHISARSMEVFRRLGVADALRAAGLPDEHPHDVAFRTTFTGLELDRIPIPGRRDRAAGTVVGPDTGWATPEPPHRLNQMFMEPLLFHHADAMAHVTIRNRFTIDTFAQDDDGVAVSATHLDSGRRIQMRGAYLVGCDGARSTVRQQLGVALQGDAVVQRVQSSFIRGPKLLARTSHVPAWATIVLNERRSGTVYAIDGAQTFLVHNYLRADEADFDAVDRDRSIRTILGVGGDLPYELLSREDWFGRRLIAERFRDRRVFLCGDAAHIWVPYAGYGMNAGIADAADLGWLLAAHLNGWAPATILDAYERERLPITDQVSRHAMAHAESMIANRAAIPADLEAPGPLGERVRSDYGRAMVELNVAQYCCAGLNFGSYYDDSPLIVTDDEPAPRYTMGTYTPSTVPGCRLPHIWLSDGSSIYDRLGADYTLLCVDDRVDTAPVVTAAARRHLPLVRLDLHDEPAIPGLRHALVIVRPDQHVAWRGATSPADADALVERLRGATPAAPPRRAAFLAANDRLS